MEKRVGIITYYNFYNYGSILQAFALSKKIDALGYEAVLIDYANMNYKWNRKLRLHVLWDRAICLIKHPYLIKKALFTKRVGNNVLKNRSLDTKKMFDSFTCQKFNLSKDDYTKKKSDYWTFVCGSDQIWQLDAPGLHYIFFLRFCERAKRIAYAASFGTYTVRKYNEKRLRKYLKSFSKISVREDVGLEIVNEYAPKLSAQQVLDPVLLMEYGWWQQFVELYNSINESYILCYFLGTSKSYFSQITKIAKYYNAKIVWVDSGIEEHIEGQTAKPTPFEFLGLVKNALYVCTDSLHGMEFSIVFEKDFTVFNRHYITGKEQQSRIDSLLKLLEVEDRRYNDIKDDEYIHPVNYDFINSTLKRFRRDSDNYIRTALEKKI